MLKTLKMANFTVFPEAELEFGKNLNIIIGENGTGKTHILKAAYAGIAASAEAYVDWIQGNREVHRFEIDAKLAGVFRAENLRNLIRRRGKGFSPETSAPLSLNYRFLDSKQNFQLRIGSENFAFKPDGRSRNSNGSVATEIKTPDEFAETRPVYFPSRELLSIYPGFVSLYETTHLPFEETWRDTAILLGAPLVRESAAVGIQELLGPLEEAMGGKLVLEDSGRFYLESTNGKIEMHLLAEGFRKLGMLARLIATGALLGKGYLFWDEPEANLNPKIVKSLARTILALAENGVQIFIASHSLFLLRELYILQQNEFPDMDTRCFGLHGVNNGVEVSQGSTIDDVGDIAALDEELLQSERYMEIA